jgi:hypothetical protein
MGRFFTHPVVQKKSNDSWPPLKWFKGYCCVKDSITSCGDVLASFELIYVIIIKIKFNFSNINNIIIKIG